MAAPVNPLSSLAFTQPELQDITRQRKLSEMLLQQGMQGSKGQMVGNIYVPSHPLENIADAFAIYKSGKLSKEANAKEQQLAKQLRETQATEAQDILSALQGRPEVAQVIPDMQTLRDDQGNLTMGAQAGSPAVAGSQQAALAKALAGQSPFAQTMAAKLMEQQFKQPKWEKVERVDQRTGNTIAGMVDVNSPQPELTFREIGVSKPALSQKDIIDFRDRGINVGGGSMPLGGNTVSVGGAMPVSASQGGAVVTPSGGQIKQADVSANMPTYQYNSSLSPAQNRELQAKFVADQQKNIKNAKESFDVIKEAADIFSTGKPTSGGFKNIGTGIAEFFDIPTEAADADAQLTILGEKLTAQVPRFEGPQSDKDTASYRAAAGDLGNANKTITTRMSALKTLIDLNKKYYPQGNWDSIDLAGPVRTKQTFFKGSKTMSPTEFRKGLTGQDQEAFDWARKNPNDPRSTEIRNRLGF
jgi:hypothetical protein